AGGAVWSVPPAARGVRAGPGDHRRRPEERATLDLAGPAPRCVHAGVADVMRRAIRLAGVACTLGLATCTENATTPGICPPYCPSTSITIIDTVMQAITRDSAYGRPVGYKIGRASCRERVEGPFMLL